MESKKVCFEVFSKLNDRDIMDIAIGIFILITAIGAILIINEVLGGFIPTSVWFLIIGALGIVAIYSLMKIRKK